MISIISDEALEQIRYQTGGLSGREATIHIFHAVSDPGELELSDEQAAKLMGITSQEFQALDSIGDSPRSAQGRLSLNDVSWWIEQRIDNISARERRKAEDAKLREMLTRLKVPQDLIDQQLAS